ncbi:class I SAM-dependent methyltransferase [Candidatus Uhrbacteria bacterium]|nr:class I SAM-dependent methyltransferase [Candidatus Uhrbacteria bacterium]
MNIYSGNNPAKQWMLGEIERLSQGRKIRVCDLGCGAGSVWPAFLKDHPEIEYVGLDTDAKEIDKAKRAFADCPNAKVMVADAQTFRQGEGTFDVVTAFSALEHVVDVARFMKTVMSMLKTGGRALLNHDAGHFRSHDIKERLMVPVSQLLAKVGIEGPYMKELKDADIRRFAEAAGGKVVSMRKHNAYCLKKHLRGGILTDEVARTWHGFEDRMNELASPEKLDPVFWATIAVVDKL